MILADTSVWVEYLRRGAVGRAGDLDPALERHEVLMCGPVATELLVGFDAAQRMRFWDRATGMHWVDLERVDWFVAGDAVAELRAQGVTVGLPDAAIAVAADKAGADLWTLDGDFERVAPLFEGLVVRRLG